MSLRVWLPLDGDLHNQGMSNVEAMRFGGLVFNVDGGKTGKNCYSPSDNNCIYSNHFQIPANTKISTSIWYKHKASDTAGSPFGLYKNDGVSYFELLINNNTIYFFINGTASIYPTFSLTGGQWYHFTMTYDGTVGILYINGEEIARGTKNNAFSSDSSVYLSIGGKYYYDSQSVTTHLGQYNDFRYYDHCLSPLEVQELAQGLIIHYNPGLIGISQNTYLCQDNSGYNNNAELHCTTRGDTLSSTLGPISFAEFNGTSSNYILTNSNNSTPVFFDDFTINFWFNLNNTNLDDLKNVKLCFGSGVRIDIEQRNTKYYLGCAFDKSYPFNYNTVTSVELYSIDVSILKSEWNMITFAVDSNYIKIYLNGEYHSQTYVPDQISYNSNKKYHIYFNGCYIGGTEFDETRKFIGSIGDFRCYCTTLTEEAIKSLYNVSMRIDPFNKIYTYNLDEEDKDLSKIAPNKKLYFDEFNEIPLMLALKYDTRLWVEPDGSKWVHIYHHNAPQTNGVFVNGDGTKCTDEQFENSLYLDENRWFDMRICNYVDKWEIMTVRRASSSNDFVVTRWIQPANPMTASYNDVTNDSLTLITGGVTWMNSSGAYSQSYGYAGYYRNTLAGDQSYILASNKSTTWYGAIGAKQYWSSTGGTTSFNSTSESNAVKTGSVDIYLRFDNINTFSNVKIFDEHKIFANEFIEY